MIVRSGSTTHNAFKNWVNYKINQFCQSMSREIVILLVTFTDVIN